MRAGRGATATIRGGRSPDSYRSTRPRIASASTPTTSSKPTGGTLSKVCTDPTWLCQYQSHMIHRPTVSPTGQQTHHRGPDARQTVWSCTDGTMIMSPAHYTGLSVCPQIQSGWVLRPWAARNLTDVLSANILLVELRVHSIAYKLFPKGWRSGSVILILNRILTVQLESKDNYEECEYFLDRFTHYADKSKSLKLLLVHQFKNQFF